MERPLAHVEYKDTTTHTKHTTSIDMAIKDREEIYVYAPGSKVGGHALDSEVSFADSVRSLRHKESKECQGRYRCFT